MQYIEAISKEEPIFKRVLFLAGGITNCPDWQRYVVDKIQDLNITIFNPRRKIFDISTPEQIEWEYRSLRQSNFIVFWFCKETLCPITLFEYGAALEREDCYLIVGCDPGYARLPDVLVQTKLRRPSIVVQQSLDDIVKKIKQGW